MLDGLKGKIQAMPMWQIGLAVLAVLVLIVLIISLTATKSSFGAVFSQGGGVNSINSSGFAQYTGANILALKGDESDDMPDAFSGCGARKQARDMYAAEAKRAQTEAAQQSATKSGMSDEDLAKIATGH